MLTELLEQSASGPPSPMRKADGRHNARLSTSWREVISHSPRGIPASRYVVSGNLSPPLRSRTRSTIRSLQIQSSSRF